MSGAQDMSGRAIDPTLRLLANPELLQKRIDQLDAAEQKAQAVIDRVGPIEDLEKTRAQAEQARQAANVELAKQKELTEHSRVECERLISEATAAASRKVAEAEIAAKKLLGNAQSVMATADSVMHEAGDATKAAIALGEDLKSKDKSLQQKADALASREQELKETKERFAKLSELIQQNIP